MRLSGNFRAAPDLVAAVNCDRRGDPATASRR